MKPSAQSALKRALVLALAFLLVASAGAVAPVVAQDQPGEPHNFYGAAADEAGEPVPTGTELYALIDGEVEDSITVDEEGRYGGEEAFDDKLSVNDGAGDEVTFRVGSPTGPVATESPFDLSEADGGVTELDLTFPAGAFDEPADFRVSIDEAASTLVAPEGGELTVAATISNDGETDGMQDVVATVGGDEVDIVSDLSLDAGEEESVSLSFAAESNYDGESVSVATENDSASAALSVEDPSGWYDISIGEDNSTTEIQPGDNATVEAVVENTGDRSTPTDLEFILDGGAFDDDVVDKQTVEVEPGNSKTVTFAVQLDEEGDYNATVTLVDFGSASTTLTVDEEADPAPGPGIPPAPPDPGEANIQVTDADLSADRIDVGGDVNVTATLENLGEASGLASVSLTVDGETVTSEVISLDAGEEASLTFTRSFDEAGEYAIAVDGTAAGTLTVGSADVSVTDASVSDNEISTGDSVDVAGTLVNEGVVPADVTVELLIDGEVVDSQSGSVDAGTSETVSFTHTFDTEGTYDIAINDANAGTVTVSANSGTGDGGDGVPGFGPVAAMIALLAVVALGRYRTA